MINPEVVRNWKTRPVQQKYTSKDTILYALGAGAGASPSDLPFVYEAHLKPLPTMAAILAAEDFWMMDPRTGLDWKKLLHGEQRLTLYKPLSPEGEVTSTMLVDGLYDRGENKGAVITLKRELREADTRDLIATVGVTAMLLGDGGFGGTDEGLPRMAGMPSREPDASIEMATRPDQGLIYRLSGDYNPLHIDPEVASYAGFEKPILHGLCTYAIAGRAILQYACDNNPNRLRQLDVRFSKPVYPGETIMLDVWEREDESLQFQCRVKERDVVIISSGLAKLSD